MANEDLALVRRAISGEEEASRELTTRVERVAKGCLSDLAARSPAVRGEEQDLLQRFQVMLLEKDMQALRSYQGRASLHTWIRVVASRFFIRRAGRLPKEKPIDALTLDELTDPSESPETHQIRRSESLAVKRVLSDLADEERLLLALLYEQELPAHRVGKMLGLTASGVRMRKQRLLKKLEKRLRGLEP